MDPQPAIRRSIGGADARTVAMNQRKFSNFTRVTLFVFERQQSSQADVTQASICTFATSLQGRISSQD
jgi:hypothetical protein